MIQAICRKNVIILVAILVLCGAGLLGVKAEPAFGAEQAALDVYYDDTCLKSFTMSELESIAVREGSKKYTYSGFNTFPSWELFKDVEGPTVAGVLDVAMKADGKSLNQIGDLQTIVFRAYDGVEERFLKGSLLSERYYFPEFTAEQDRMGQAVLPESSAGAAVVPAVISLRENGRSYPDSREVGRLLFGQKAPNEQNHSMFVKYLATKDAESAGNRGRITICSEAKAPARQLQPISSAEASKDGITFDRSVNASHTEGGGRYWIFYTADGTEPTIFSDMYNYNNYNFGESNEKFNRPALPKAGQPLKVKVFSLDRLESETSTFYFPGKVTIKAPALKGKAVIVKWKKAADADGYQIWRAVKKGGPFKLVKTVKKGTTVTWKNTGLKKATYYYKVRAYRTCEGNTGYGSFSAVKNIKVK